MPLISELTPLAADLAALNSSILESAEALNHAAGVLANGHARLWSLPVDRLLDVLNADVSRTLEVFAANTATGTAINAQLAALGLERFSNRVPVVPGREDIAFEEDQFVYVEPEPELEE